ESNKIFNKPLKECISLASAEVVLQSENVSFGKIPLIIAKCGSILKKHALSEPGIFRIAGNTKKIKLLQTIFSTPPKYGQDWKFEEDILPHGFRQFSVHDVSGILRRFLNNMSEPLIPLDCYNKFRNHLANQRTLIKQIRICLKKFEIYIREGLEDCNKQTLLYLLDLLFLFSQHSDKNLMDAKNLAAIFQPSILSHPEHDMNPKEYELSRIVLEFLI
ncbi:RhoGAP-domain-containing protein, partial [Hanseniaspora valbyensis NRRL Y-1626]